MQVENNNARVRQRVHQVHLKSRVDNPVSDEFIKGSTEKSCSVGKVQNDLPHAETPSNAAFSPASFKETFRGIELKIVTEQKVEVDDTTKFQWSPLASKKVMQQNSDCDEGNIFKERGMEFGMSPMDSDIYSSFHVNDAKKNESMLMGTWMNKRVFTESIFRKRFVWIDCHSKRLYWCKKSDKYSTDKKFIDLQVDLVHIDVSSDKRGFVCSCANGSRRVDSKPQILFQLLSKERRESEVAEWVESIKQIKNAPNIATTGNCDHDEFENAEFAKKKLRRKPILYKVIAPGSRQDYQHPVKIEPRLDRCLSFYTVFS